MNKSDRIKFISKYLRWFFVILFIANPIMLVIAWLQFPAIVPGLQIIKPVPMFNLYLGIFLSLIPTACAMLICWFLIKLFKSYELGDFFTAKEINNLKRIAQFLFLKELINPFYQAAITATLTWHHPPGQGMSIATIGTNNLYSLIIATIALLISWIMAEAYAIQEEQRYTI